MNWIMNGKMPSLWVYARMLLVLGVLSMLAGMAASIFIAVSSKGAMVAGSLFAGLSLSTPAALFLIGSGLCRFMAAKEDRDRAQAVVNPAQP